MNKFTALLTAATLALGVGHAAPSHSVTWNMPAQHLTHSATQRVTNVRRQFAPRRVISQKIVQTCRPVTVKVGRHWHKERSCISHVYRLQTYRGVSRWVETW